MIYIDTIDILKNYLINLINLDYIILQCLLFFSIIVCLYSCKQHMKSQIIKKMSKNELFFEYDTKRNLNNNNEIIRMMKLLGYYSYNIDELQKKYINNIITSIISDKKNYCIEDCTIRELAQIIMKSEHYVSYNNFLNYNLKRSIILSKHINDKTTQYFYKSINEDEIVILDKLKALLIDR